MRSCRSPWSSVVALAALLAIVPAKAWPGAAGVPPGVIDPTAEVAVDPARLWVGSARVLRFGRAVGTVVVGRSEVIATDVIDKRTIVLTALAPGWTDIVVLGQEGDVLSRLSVIVRAPEWPTKEVYRGTERSTLICDPECRAATAQQPAPPAQ